MRFGRTKKDSPSLLPEARHWLCRYGLLGFLLPAAIINVFFLLSAIRTRRSEGDGSVATRQRPPTTASVPYPIGNGSFLISGSRNKSNVSVFVSFVVPTKMRETLHRTALSLKNQTRDNWEAIIGIDVHNIDSASLSKQFNDDRFSYMLIATVNKDRGPALNGAGELRNKMITAARGEWVAFVDDDDTISPYYVEWLEDCLLKEKKRDDKRVDLVLFRMRIARKFHSDETILPPLRHRDRARNSWVGISFAVRRNLFASNKLAFTTHNAEDYNLLKAAYEKGINMKIANCVAYFVKTSPEMLPGSCSLSNLTIE